LSVGSVVGGSVARSGDVLRVRVRLLDPATAEELFSRSFQDGMDDLFGLQDRVADEVALFLRERLGREIVLRGRRERASSSAAWEMVNRAEELADDGSRLEREGRTDEALSALRVADSLAARAEALDLAWSGPALMRGRIAYAMAFADRSDPRWIDGDWLDRAVEHAERALRIDSLSADALALRGELRYRLGAWTSDTRDSTLLALAEADLGRAVDLEPGLAGAWYVIGEAQYRANRFREAKVSLTTAYQADAYLTEARTVIQLLFSSSLEVEEFEDARRWCDTGRRRFPDDVRFVDCEITLLGWTGRGPQHIARALEVLDDVTRADSLGAFGPKPAYARMWIAALYARTGMAAEARAFIDSAQRVAGDIGPAADVRHIEAYVRLLLGRRDAALRVLSDYLALHPESRPYVARSPWFKSVRGDGDFAALFAASE
jgi:tetratricopeptide (TPR) repeat protein